LAEQGAALRVVRRKQEQARCHCSQYQSHAEDSEQGTASVRGQMPGAQTQQHDSDTAQQQGEEAHNRGEGSDNLMHCLVSFSKASREPPVRFHS
jgi:hypothetical protein